MEIRTVSTYAIDENHTDAFYSLTQHEGPIRRAVLVLLGRESYCQRNRDCVMNSVLTDGHSRRASIKVGRFVSEGQRG